MVALCALRWLYGYCEESGSNLHSRNRRSTKRRETRACVCVRVRVRNMMCRSACMRACVSACVHTCVYGRLRASTGVHVCI